MSEEVEEEIFDAIEKIVSYTKKNGIPVFENLDLNREIIVDLDKEEVVDLYGFNDFDDNLDPKFNKFELENLDLSDSDSDSNNDIVNSCIEIASDLEELLKNDGACKQLINQLNGGGTKEKLENLSQEKFQIYERRNWIFLQLLCEYAIQKQKNLNELLNFIDIKENDVMQAIIRKNKFGCLEGNKYAETEAVSTIWFLNEIKTSIEKDDYISVFNTKRGISNDICGDLLFEYLEENKETDNFIKKFSLNLNGIENGIELSETDDQENNIIFLHDVNKFIKFRENKGKFSYRIFKDKNFTFGETVFLQTISDKCHFWNRNRILKNVMQNKLSDIYDFANKLPANRRDEFFVWVYNNRGNFNSKRAQDAGFFTCEQEELLKLVPTGRQDEFRKLFRNENFRNVCQTSQAIENLLTITEACSLNPNNLSDIYDFANKLPENRRDEFFVWVRNNRGNFNFKRAQDAGFFTPEQEELLKLVPIGRQDEFRKLFRNENFRNVCQTSQAIKNLLTITEACSLNPIEYINHCLPYGEIEHIKIALDTFDADKIYNICGDQLNRFPEGVEKMYLFYFIHSWITFSFDINKIDDSIISKENKNKLFNKNQLACADYSYLQQFISELSCPENIKDNLFNYLDKIFSKDAIEYYQENIKNVEPGESYKSFDARETISRNFLKQFGYKENANVTETFSNIFAMLATVNLNDKQYFLNNLFPDFLSVADYNCIVDLFDYAAKENNWDLYNDILIENLDKPKFKEIKIKVMKVMVEKKQHFITEAFENDNDKLNQFRELIKTENDIFYFINSKDEVLILFELLKSKFDIAKINVLDFDKIKLVIQNVGEKKQFFDAFGELSQKNYPGYIFEFVSNLECENLNIGENILKLNELSKAGLNISNTNYVSYNGFKKINLMLENKNEDEKNKLYQKFVEFSKKKFFIDQAINFSETIAKGIEENNLSEKNYSRLRASLSSSELIINSNPKLLADFLLINFEPGKLAYIVILLEELTRKNKYFEFADDFKCYLAAHPEVAEALVTEKNKKWLEAALAKNENIPKLETPRNKVEVQKQ